MSLPEKNDYNALGGELIDYSPVEDPSTDLSAEASNEMRSDIAGITQICMRAWCGFSVDGYGDAIIGDTEQDYGAVYGRALAYKPTILKTAPGFYTIIFPASVVDPRGNSKNINIQFPFGYCADGGYLTNVARLDASSVIVTVRDTVSNIPADPMTKVYVAFI